MIDFASIFAAALGYDAFLARHATPEQRQRWDESLALARLGSAQEELLTTFARDMNVLCLAGTWCGDCVEQCPILERIARACPKIHLRYIDRDVDQRLAAELQICGGRRVPVVVFLSEDFSECCRYGDRTLSRYRAMAQEPAGPACPTGIAETRGGLAEATEDWMREFERVQLMLRLSPRLRHRHGD